MPGRSSLPAGDGRPCVTASPDAEEEHVILDGKLRSSATEVMRAPRCPKADSGRRVADQAETLHHGAISLGMQQWLVEQLRKRVQLKPGDAGDAAGKPARYQVFSGAQYRRHDTRGVDPTKRSGYSWPEEGDWSYAAADAHQQNRNSRTPVWFK